MFGNKKLKAEIERLKIENESLKDDLFIQQIRSKNTSDKLMRCIKKKESNSAFVDDQKISEIRELLNKVYFDQSLYICSKDKLVSEYEKVLSDCYVRDSKGRFMRYRKEEKPSYKVTNKDLIGDIKGFPKEVVELMLERQYEQTGKINVKVFQTSRVYGKPRYGFTWNKSKEGLKFWDDVICNKNFNTFFEKYPKKNK